MAPSSTRTLWKGAISFGLVYIPVTLHSATEEHRLKFNLLDKRSMNPVGNQQVNKSTGKAMQKEDVVKGFEYEKDQYVVVTPEEIKAALPKSTQTIEIESFIDAGQIPSTYYNKPYYVAPAAKGNKPYLLLLETLRKTGKVGLAKVVISTRQHLAALFPAEDGLVLELLRWHDEVRDTAGLPLPKGDDAHVSPKELKMAEQLVTELADKWKPESFHDEFREKLEKVVEAKVKAGKGEHIVKPIEGEEMQSSADIIDLTELLRRSLRKGGGKGAANDEADEAEAETPARKPPSRRKAANDETPSRTRAAAAAKTKPRASASVKAKPRKKAA
ncbi:Ku protein [Caenimonas aquaedulcis]|uniref:Non-homologous end joining protein Ku n=1 Tax=Caenimonas aquaedulcis TaxID=2793270 RepID=A0A931H1V4_9BURK|nr:Ku protein [Caenimonas aquaedulcis]MBG9387013.1 Ku protein [Caenimonas aquaedulcis]